MLRLFRAFFAAILIGGLIFSAPAGATLTTGPFVACQGLDQILGLNAAGTHLVIDGVEYLLPGPFQTPAAFEFRRATSTGFVVASATDLVPPNDRRVVFLIPPIAGDLLVEVEDVSSARGFAFECVFENSATSPLSRLAFVENSNPTGTDQRVRWVDVSDPPGADGFSLHDDQIEFVRFAPSGTAAVVKHHLPVDAEWAVIDTCPGATGTVLANFQNLGADVSLALIDTGGAFAVELTPQGGTPVQVAVDDCLGGGPTDHTLDVTVAGTGQGLVTGDAGQISCSTSGGSCQGTYAEGTVVQLTATASGGSRFVSWGGDCSGTAPTTTVTLDQDRACSADFDVAEADLDPFLSAMPDPAVAGGEVAVVVGVSNHGPDPTTFSEATLILPEGFTFQAPDSDPTCGLLGSNVRCSFGIIASGSSASATVGLAVAPDLRGTRDLVATAFGLPTDPVPGNDSETLQLATGGSADLVLTKQSVIDPAAAGGAMAWTVEVTNLGPSTALDAIVTDPLPPWISSPFDPNAATLSCAIGELAPGESRRVTIFGRIDGAAPPGTVITNTADVGSVDLDPSPGDAMDSADLTIAGPPAPSAENRWTRIATIGEPGPLGQPWESFEEPAVDGEAVAFAGYVGGGLSSDVRWWLEGTAFPVVESSSGVPGAGGDLPVFFYGVSADGGQVAFTGTGGGFSGSYGTALCGLELFADDAGNLGGGFEGQISGGAFVQVASGSDGFYGVVLAAGSSAVPAAVLAAREDQIPGAPVDTFFDGFGTAPAWDGTTAVFYGDAGAPNGGNPDFPGIFWWRDGALDVVADTSTPAPDGAFESFSVEVAVDGDLAWFFATTAGGRGLYRADLQSGVISLIANPTVALPGGAGTFAFLGQQVAADAGRAVFVASADPIEAGGIFLADASGLRRLATDGETLPDGEPLTLPRIGRDALDGRYVGVRTGFLTFVPESVWRLDVEAGALFADGFESGDLSAWSETSP